MERIQGSSFHTISGIPHGEKGISPESKMYLHLPSDFACEALYYAPYIGEFHCNDHYCTKRQNYDYYLLILIDKGALYVEFEGKSFLAHARDIVLIDCKKPHLYRADEAVSFRYFHFDGCSSEQYYRMLTQKHGYLMHPKRQATIEGAFRTLLSLAPDGLTNEHRISTQIHIILSELANQEDTSRAVQNTIITQAASYLEQHFTEPLTIESIAARFNLSPYYFSRLFQRYTGMPPHAYMIHLRIILAQNILSSSTQSIESICDLCGFNSSQHFIRCFKQHTGISPNQYRKQTRG